ncbi:HNH endonuclease [Kitasatospora sp. NPDC005751]|uniref:HNH endonuclease n=1 Tax=Kitasatospora sp. NPDC005751 TaxID=3157064 RepID=UPI003400344B
MGEQLAITSDDLRTELYTKRMAKPGSPGRHIYDALRQAAPNGICPLCAVGVVSTLDHVMPKAIFPALAVTPLNLVPACGDCNKTKTDRAPATAREQFIHPYYDNLDGVTWLHAEPLFEDPVRIVFSVRTPPDTDPDLTARLTHHFTALKLAERYAAHAAQELLSQAKLIRDLRTLPDPGQLREHLDQQADTRSAANPNSWQSAMYRALADSDRFCSQAI